MASLNESYTSNPINQINFSYIEKEGLAPEDSRKLLETISDNKVTFHRFNNYNLPISMNPADYGTIILEGLIQAENIHRYVVKNGPRSFQIDVSLDGLVNKVTILGAADLNWIDTKLPADAGFMREIGKSTKYFIDGINVLNKQILPAKPFKRQLKDWEVENMFVTMDIETINENGRLIPYLICGYNGKEYITSYATADPAMRQQELFSMFMDQLLSKSFMEVKKVIVYAHNLSGFDGIFLMKHLLAHGKVEPLLFNGKLMSINLKTSSGKTVIFKDSYLLLPQSLRKLCEAFNIATPKGYFPFVLTDIFYIGILPKINYWGNIPLSAYTQLINKFNRKVWSFKEESIKYCQLDCLSLHKVLTQFNELIFSEFKLNVHKPLTLPALAMKIYKTNFMPKDLLYQIPAEVDQNIRQSYTGGAVDVYIPHNRINPLSKRFKKLYYYDVNSLYPTVMSLLPMPVGKPIAFEGNIRLVEPNAFGIFQCNITSPAKLQHPILQRRIKGHGTVAGLGTWTGWISSMEMDNAVKFGYTFEIIKGYQFEQGDLFSKYVTKMYNLRMEYDKNHPMNFIAKLLMNSLYGKFGMKLEKTTVDIFNLNLTADKIALKALLSKVGESIQDHVELGDNKYLFVRSTISNLLDEDSYHGSDVNIAIASTITAAARVHMSIFKNNPNFNLYYSDTDSAVTDAPIEPKYVGKHLGQLKLEHNVRKAVFLAPKVYGLIDEKGQEIIKVKGIVKEMLADIHIQDLELLLIKDSSREFSQTKWYKKVIEGEISVADVAYAHKVTSNKRDSVYINNIYSNTKPFNYDEIKLNNKK